MARAIHAFKYEDRPELAEGLASLLIETAGTFLATSPQYMCALPLHRGRFLRRRYDQAQLLARAVARQLGRQFASDFLRRTRDTPRQVDLNESQREENVAGAFEGLPAARGHSILLVDDVLTTGATARAASQALLDAGAAWVQVLTLARA